METLQKILNSKYGNINRKNPLYFCNILLLFFTISISNVASAQELFFIEESPSPPDQSELRDIDVDPDGRLVAVGKQRNFNTGGSFFFPLVVSKDKPEDPWLILNPPNFGMTGHELWAVKFIPETDGDFIVVGEYLPDPLFGYANGMLLRYYRNTGTWDIHEFSAPGALFHFIRDVVFDPDNPSRILIAGTRGIDDGGGFCFEFTTMVVDYNIDTNVYSVIPTTQKGALWSISPLSNGNFITAGIAASDCDYIPFPVVMEVESGTEIIHPNPPPATNNYWYYISALTTLSSGQIFMVGSESPLGAENSRTLGFIYNSVTQNYQSYKPIDPDSTQVSINNLWDVAEGANGLIYAVGRSHYIYQSLHYRKAMVQSFDGIKWSLHPLPQSFDEGLFSELWGMTILPNGQVYAAGNFRPVSSFDSQTLVMHNELVTQLSSEENYFSTSTDFLCQNYPNPFNPTTNIRFRITDYGFVSLKVYDVLGNEILNLINEFKPAGEYEVSLNAANLPGGVYFYKLQSGDFVETKKMILLR